MFVKGANKFINDIRYFPVTFHILLSFLLDSNIYLDLHFRLTFRWPRLFGRLVDCQKTPFTELRFWFYCYLHPQTFFALLIPKKNALDFGDIVSLLLINSRDSREDWQLILLCCCQPSPWDMGSHVFQFPDSLFNLFHFRRCPILKITRICQFMSFPGWWHFILQNWCFVPGSGILQRISDTCSISFS